MNVPKAKRHLWNVRLNLLCFFLQQITSFQIRYLKDSLASAKIDLDLQLEKVERERASFTDGHKAELDMKNMALAKLKEELADKETLLDLTREELVSLLL